MTEETWNTLETTVRLCHADVFFWFDIATGQGTLADPPAILFGWGDPGLVLCYWVQTVLSELAKSWESLSEIPDEPSLMSLTALQVRDIVTNIARTSDNETVRSAFMAYQAAPF